MSANAVKFWLFVSVVMLVGLGIGYRLSLLTKVESSALLTAGGLSYDFLGVLVLSEFIGAKWKTICVEHVAPVVLWLHALIPLGALVGGYAALLMHKPTGEIVVKFFFGFFGYSLLPLSIFQELVVLPKLPFVKKDVENRWRWFGFFLLISGVALQLIAAILVLLR